MDLEEWRFSEQLSLLGSSGQGLPWGSILALEVNRPWPPVLEPWTPKGARPEVEYLDLLQAHLHPSTLRLSIGTGMGRRG